MEFASGFASGIPKYMGIWGYGEDMGRGENVLTFDLAGRFGWELV